MGQAPPSSAARRAVRASGCVAAALLALSAAAQESPLVVGEATAWPAYGGDDGGRRYSPLAQITRANVERLEIAWVHRSGGVSDGRGA